MKYILPVLSILLFASCSDSVTAVSGDSANSDSVNGDVSAKNMTIAGTYGFGENPEVEAVGTLVVFPETDSTFLFYLDFTRGAPSYNMGQVADRARLRNNTWTYAQEAGDSPEGCALEFMFSEKAVQIITREKECGFGANVIVDHVYNRITSTVPEFFIAPEGDTVYFSNLAKAVK